MKLVLSYITNNPKVALIAEKYGVDRIWIDLETLGKEKRQRGINSVKSHHTVEDIKIIKPLLSKSEMLVRVNSWYEGSFQEINQVIEAGADIVMLPYWKTIKEVKSFLTAVNHRAKTILLLETKEAVDCIDDVLKLDFNEIFIGLNDLHLSYGLTFMFELLSNGVVEDLCDRFKSKGIPYGFGGIARLGEGLLPAENIIMEHYRLGSTRAILSRSFCDYESIGDLAAIETIFRLNMKALCDFEDKVAKMDCKELDANKQIVADRVDSLVQKLKGTNNGLNSQH